MNISILPNKESFLSNKKSVISRKKPISTTEKFFLKTAEVQVAVALAMIVTLAKAPVTSIGVPSVAVLIFYQKGVQQVWAAVVLVSVSAVVAVARAVLAKGAWAVEVAALARAVLGEVGEVAPAVVSGDLA
jgi:hypothetical protein